MLQSGLQIFQICCQICLNRILKKIQDGFLLFQASVQIFQVGSILIDTTLPWGHPGSPMSHPGSPGGHPWQRLKNGGNLSRGGYLYTSEYFYWRGEIVLE